MKVLCTGADGYIGRALTYELDARPDITNIGVDNLSRRKWVEECGGDYDDTDIGCIEADLSKQETVYNLLAIHKPDAIIHLASQPSMPYSQVSGERALFTQTNNTSMCTNILWAIKELALKTRLIITTTTGIPGQVYAEIPEMMTLNAAGSWYHVSRGFDSANCHLAAKQWNQEIIELRTSIVYGIQTHRMKTFNAPPTRFDTDPYFGTALNRFVDQAVLGKPITIYGKGEQTKPFICLDDCVESLIKALELPLISCHEIINQVTENISIKKLAELINYGTPTKIEHVPNPRKENEEHQMKFENKRFLQLLGRPPRDIDKEVREFIEKVQDMYTVSSITY